jgi:hypothetical protein
MAIFAISAVFALTTSNNILFGNNNKIVVNGDVASSPSPSPPSSSPETYPTCGLVEEPADVNRFPPAKGFGIYADTGPPLWSNPMQLGTKGYQSELYREDLLRPAVVDQRYLYFPFYISCLGARGLLNKLAKDANPFLPGSADNTMFKLPSPVSVDTANGETYMDKYIPWKQETLQMEEGRTKRIRKLFATLVEGFGLILAFEQLNGVAEFGSRYVCDVMFKAKPQILPVDRPMGTEQQDVSLLDPDLFPLYPTVTGALATLRAEYIADPTGLSDYFSNNSWVPSINSLSILGNIDAHVLSAISSTRVQSGFTEEAIAQSKALVTGDQIDNKADTTGIAHKVLPGTDGWYTLKPFGSTGKLYPTGFEICLDSRNLYDFATSPETTRNGVTFACGLGGQLLAAISKIHQYEIQLDSEDVEIAGLIRTGTDPASIDSSKYCTKSIDEVDNMAYAAIQAVSDAEDVSYGIFGNPQLTPEQVRVTLTFLTSILYKHIGYMNSRKSCEIAGKTYYGRAIVMGDYMRLKSYYSNEWLESSDASKFVGEAGRQALASVSELRSMHDNLAAVCPTAMTDWTCPDLPNDLIAPNKTLIMDVYFKNLFESKPEIANTAVPYNKCEDQDYVWGPLFANSGYSAFTTCAMWLGILQFADDTYVGTPGQIAGCGVESYLISGIDLITNWDDTISSVCGKSCKMCP